MVDRFYGYQYDTNPKKLGPEYKPYRNKYPNSKNTSISKNESKNTYKTNTKLKTKPSIKQKSKVSTQVKSKKMIKPRIKLIATIFFGFSVLFTISYQNSLINESFSKKEQLKSELGSIQKTNEQLKVSIENSLNLNTVEQAAKERVGMQKLTNNQKKYISLPKRDYVEPAAEEIIMEENINIFTKVVKGFTKGL